MLAKTREENKKMLQFLQLPSMNLCICNETASHTLTEMCAWVLVLFSLGIRCTEMSFHFRRSTSALTMELCHRDN